MYNDYLISNFNKEKNDALARIFTKLIKKNFLLNIKQKVKDLLGMNIYNYFDMDFSTKKLVSGNLDMSTLDYEVCRYIVGIHRANLIFVSDEERVLKEKDLKYIEKLVNDVITHIKLRQYSGKFFRKQPIMKGENFICFPVPYDLFAISINAIILLHNNIISKDTMFFVFSQIFNKSLAALSMLEDNFLDNAYPICRGAIELYLKMLLLLNRQEVVDKYFEFSKFEVEQSCCGKGYTKEFLTFYNKRFNKKNNNKVEFLHFGWVDGIIDCHQVVKNKHYSINGIVTYLKSIYKTTDNDFFEDIEILYKMCHGYTHGSIQYVKYPLINYFEISMILTYIISHSYQIVCERYSVTTKINEIDILEKLNSDFVQLEHLHSIRSTENFENYYKQKFNQILK